MEMPEQSPRSERPSELATPLHRTVSESRFEPLHHLILLQVSMSDVHMLLVAQSRGRQCQSFSHRHPPLTLNRAPCPQSFQVWPQAFSTTFMDVTELMETVFVRSHGQCDGDGTGCAGVACC
jgi:hypothetical protein